MESLQGKVAVITGGASGIGLAMAEAFAKQGAKLMLQDIEQDALDTVAEKFKADGVEVATMVGDVSKFEDVDALANKTYETYGAAHIICNNAGVGFGGASWEISLEDWEWVLGVDLWGVVYGIKAFVPRMLEGGEEGHIVNTASMAGLSSGPGMAPYNVSKHSVVTLSECLHHELNMFGSKIKVSVLCPGWVNTKVVDSTRNRPGGEVNVEDVSPMAAQLDAFVREATASGMAPEAVANLVADAILNEKFYILPHQEWKGIIETRMRDILEERPPTMIQRPEDAGV